MYVLIMGETSQAVCIAFRNKGHKAFSCDLQDCVGGYPEWHIKMDMFDAFAIRQWDVVIAHPTCKYMANSGALRLYIDGKKKNGIDTARWHNMKLAANEFKRILNLPVGKLCVENPIMHCHAKNIVGVHQTQTIQPYEYGHPESKRTCLWLKGLPPLKPTNILELPESGHWDNQTPSGQNKLAPSSDRWQIRSKTYKGIAEAMAEQWG